MGDTPPAGAQLPQEYVGSPMKMGSYRDGADGAAAISRA